MMINVWDMDMTYDISIDTNADGEDFIMIQASGNGDDNYIALNADQAREWSRVLEFMANELEKK